MKLFVEEIVSLMCFHIILVSLSQNVPHAECNVIAFLHLMNPLDIVKPFSLR